SLRWKARSAKVPPPRHGQAAAVSGRRFRFQGMSNPTAVLDETMADLESPQTPRAILSSPFEARSGEMPAWFREQQEAAWTKFEALPYPNRKDQAWRFSNVNALDFSSSNFGPAVRQ